MRKIIAEFFGSAFLLMIVVGSGIMGNTLASGNQGIALLANSLATGLGLYTLILCLGPISGAHFNPAVSLFFLLRKQLSKSDFIKYAMAQFVGSILGVMLVHFIFGQEIIQLATKERYGVHLWLSEVIATFGLLSVITLARSQSTPVAVAAYITSAYWFTSSTSFANPAVTFARMLTNTFCGIAPNGVLYFILSQFIAVFLAILCLRSKTIEKF